MGDLLWLTYTAGVTRPKTQLPSRLECKGYSELRQDFRVCQTGWDIFPDTGNWALQEDWGRRVEVTLSDPAEEFGSDMLLFHLYLWKPEWQMLGFRLWLGLPNVHFTWQSQLTAWPLSPSSHMRPPHPSLLPTEVKVRKNKHFKYERKDPVGLFTCPATAYDNGFATYHPLLKPASELSTQTWVSLLEPSSQSLSPCNNQKLPAKVRTTWFPRSNHLPSSHLHSTLLSAFLAPTAQGADSPAHIPAAQLQCSGKAQRSDSEDKE